MELRAETLDGRPFSLAEAVASHKAVVFVFFSVTCPYARLFAADVRDLSERYRERKVLFVGVFSNRGESREEVAAYARKHRLEFPSLKDTGARVADALDARVTPEAFLVDSAGRLLYQGQVLSKQGKPYLEEAIQAVLADRPVRKARVKAFGCAIDRGPDGLTPDAAPRSDEDTPR
jgi:peroxiredoxin